MAKLFHKQQRKLSLVIAAALLGVSISTSAFSSTLRIAMTAGDIPLTLGQPDQGFEGNRFTGIPLYDSLTEWDLSQATKPSDIVPGLATEWHVDANDKTKWIFTLRDGVKFTDGTPVNADAIVWNANKVLDKTAPQYAPGQIGNTLSRMPNLKGIKKISDNQVEIETKVPTSLLPYNISFLYIVSPTAWKKLYDAVPESAGDVAARSKIAWTEFASAPVGSGPFKVEKLVPRQQLVLDKNPDYWNPKRVPKVDQVVLIPMPDANARTAALLSHQVDWIEAPAPDAIPQMKSQGFKVYSNTQPHLWPWQFNMSKGSPWQNIKVREAANLCIDREGLKTLLGGYMTPATGVYEKGSPWYGNPDFKISYNPEKAKKLMEEAGYSASHPLTFTVATSSSGSGQMQPLQMNQYLQANLKQCYFDPKIKVIEWNTLFTDWRLGVKDPVAKGLDAINVSATTLTPYFGLIRFSTKGAFPPKAQNWGYFSTPETEKYAHELQNAFTPEAFNAAAAKLDKAFVDAVPMLFVAHDVGPRAMAPDITGVVQPQSWFIDLALVNKK